ncbi:MAG: AAA family ATPase [Myxococcales bacterium]|nr:AAA family ATPase [Myxococcales bacterium]
MPHQHRLRLEPVDCLVVVEADGFAYHIADWPGALPEMPLFVGDHYRPVTPRRVERRGDDVWLVLDEALDPTQVVYWAGRSCNLTAAPSDWPEVLIPRRADGAVAPIVRRTASGARLLLVVEGPGPIELFDGAGAPIGHRSASPEEGATALRVDGGVVPWSGERTITRPTLPDAATLCADNDVRWRWSAEDERGGRRRGVWIQLLAPDEIDSESTVDIRAAYCEEGVREVRTGKRRRDEAYRVFSVRRADYQLELERLPPKGSTLFISTSTAGLYRQRHAVFRLMDGPLPHHRPLLALCEDPTKVQWPVCRPASVARWHLLADARWSGTEQQRAFVEKALGTPDFAFLEGPPGSGKTHAICELVLQFIERGERVLLCSTTNVAVDNVLERLGRFDEVEALRIGLVERVDHAVRTVQIDERIRELVEAWRAAGVFTELDDAAIRRAAESTLLAVVNLTCGTSTGILAHPYLRRTGDDKGEDPGPGRACFDVLIIDEASKTTFQEFLVPAQLARRWIIVGDVRQLPPFSEARDLEASIAEVADEKGAKLSEAHQAALLILFRLRRREAGGGRVRWLIEEPDEVLAALVAEVAARASRGEQVPECVRVVDGRRGGSGRRGGDDLDVAVIEAGEVDALRLLAADWILFPPTLRARIERVLPAGALALRDWPDDGARAFRFARWRERHGRLAPAVVEGRRPFDDAAALAVRQREFLREETWARQVAWRLGRVHQLGRAKVDRKRQQHQEEVDRLMPAVSGFAWVAPAIGAIRDIGVRSVIEAFQVTRDDPKVRRRSALTDAIPEAVWRERAVLLGHQHRMHPDISRLPRELFYSGEALNDANTLDGREARIGWSYRPELPARRLWVDVRGYENAGQNPAEIEAMRRWLEDFERFSKGHPHREGRPWEIACLSFYNRQELGIRDMLRRLTGRATGETRFKLSTATIACATVDRFQGREADLVLLSLRNTRRPGHMDSPNRLNVAVTRARFLLCVFGDRGYFAQCPSHELRTLAADSPVFDLRSRS